VWVAFWSELSVNFTAELASSVNVPQIQKRPTCYHVKVKDSNRDKTEVQTQNTSNYKLPTRTVRVNSVQYLHVLCSVVLFLLWISLNLQFMLQYAMCVYVLLYDGIKIPFPPLLPLSSTYNQNKRLSIGQKCLTRISKFANWNLFAYSYLSGCLHNGGVGMDWVLPCCQRNKL